MERIMSAVKEAVVRLNLVISPELNDRLEQLAEAGHTTKSEVVRKAFVLFDVVAEAKAEKKRIGILDEHKNLLTEIVGI
jgi:predicted transcriptional regulator